MSIVGATLLPHSPLLLPTTDPKQKIQVMPLRDACSAVAHWIHAAKPDVILCFNPHARSIGNAFTFNLAEKIHTKFEDFGDLTTEVEVQGIPKFAYHLKEMVEHLFPVATNCERNEKYGLGIPALFLQNLPKPIRWLEVSSRHSSFTELLNFGACLQTELHNTRERILIIASGEISARLTENSPSGFVDSAPTFLKHWRTAVKQERFSNFIRNTPLTLADEVQSCGAWSMAQLCGCLTSMRMHADILYDDVSFGVGYQVVTWQLA